MDFLGEAIIARHEIAVRGLANPVDQGGFDEWMEEFVADVMSGFWRVGQREMERVRCEQGAPFALQMCAVAGPAVVGRMFNHAGADRVRFDVTLACRQPGGGCWIRQERYRLSADARQGRSGAEGEGGEDRCVAGLQHGYPRR
jgi:hypothetical protein